MRPVLIVSKPLAPPWTDGSKNLARDVVRYAHDTPFEVMSTPAGGGFESLGRVTTHPIYTEHGPGFTPALAANARVLAFLLRRRLPALHHFFFAPNPRTNTVATWLYSARRGARVIHSVVSAPVGRPRYFAHTHVAVSQWTAAALRDAGAADVRVIPPGIPPAARRTPDRAALGLPVGARLVLFAGDLTADGGAEASAEAVAQTKDAVLILACRPKGEGHVQREATLRARLGNRVVSLGTVSDMPRLLASVDVLALPARSLAGKVDLPLVLLEAMQQGRPLVVRGGGPLAELAGPGVAVLEGDSPEELAEHLLRPPEGDPAARVEADFGAEAMAAAYQRLYQTLA